MKVLDTYYMEIARSAARRSTCLRRQYGAVIVKDSEIVSTGCNDAPPGDAACRDLGECVRIRDSIPHGERYELCRSVHAEMRAMILASRDAMLGATLYLYGEENGEPIKAEPCSICARMLKSAGIAQVIGSEGR